MASSQKDPRPILTYGQDAVLLETRRLVLEQSGFFTDTANTPQEFEARIAESQSPYDLYVLCHTVPVAEKHAIAAALKANTAVYQLTAAVAPPTSSIKYLSCSLFAKGF
jgi:DNA-binding response OmpR family regulator